MLQGWISPRRLSALCVACVLLFIFSCAPEAEKEPEGVETPLLIEEHEANGCEVVEGSELRRAFDGTILAGCCRLAEPKAGVTLQLTFDRSVVSRDKLYIVNGSAEGAEKEGGADRLKVLNPTGQSHRTLSLRSVKSLEIKIGDSTDKKVDLIFYPALGKDTVCLREIQTTRHGFPEKYGEISVKNLEPIRGLLQAGYYLKDQESRFLIGKNGVIEPFQGGYDCGPTISGVWGENAEGLYINLDWDPRKGATCPDEYQSVLTETDRKIRSGEFKGTIEALVCPNIEEESCVIRWKSGVTLQFHLFS